MPTNSSIKKFEENCLQFIAKEGIEAIIMFYQLEID